MLSGGRRKQALLGDAIEAIIAAVYMDAGFSAAKDLILRLWSDRIHTVKQDARDAKTALQEWAQARGFPPPAYVQTDRQGPYRSKMDRMLLLSHHPNAKLNNLRQKRY
mgnify:CR=1 FL=1